jgi:hypothetical protein
MTTLESRIEVVARALCRDAGHEPEAEVQYPPGDHLEAARHEGSGPGVLFFGPCWKLHKKEARPLAVAFGALTG